MVIVRGLARCATLSALCFVCLREATSFHPSPLNIIAPASRHSTQRAGMSIAGGRRYLSLQTRNNGEYFEGNATTDLPRGWYSALDASCGDTYYYNEAGDSTWERPTEKHAYRRVVPRQPRSNTTKQARYMSRGVRGTVSGRVGTRPKSEQLSESSTSSGPEHQVSSSKITALLLSRRNFFKNVAVWFAVSWIFREIYPGCLSCVQKHFLV